jgi:ERO1-like protein beta
MHASVSSHLSEYYIDFDAGPSPYPNVKMYFEKVGNHKTRIKNLYFAYTLVLRAFKRLGNNLLE